MKFSLRPTSLEDLGALQQFLRRALNKGEHAPSLEPAVLAWKYWDRREDWEGPRSYVLERDGVIAAHAGIYPVVFQAGEVRGVQMIDWAAAREAPGAGIALVRKLEGLFDFIYSIGGSEMTCKILPSFGFVEHTRQWRAARPLRPFRQILQHQYRNWKLAPRLVRNYLWSLPKAPLRLPEGLRWEEAGPGDVSRLLSAGAADARFSPRPPGFFDYLLRCPVMPVRLYVIHDQGGPKGHFAIGVLHGQARVAGVWLQDPGPDAWAAAFRLAQQAARGLEGACEVAVAGTQGLAEQAAIRSGLRIRDYFPVFPLNRKGKLALPPDFQFQLAADDSFFLDSGQVSYWT